MEDQATLYKDPSVLLLELMKRTFGDIFRSYYLGAPTEIPNACYPCLVVQPIDSSIGVRNAPTGFDNIRSTINIEILFNGADDVNSPDDADTTMRKIFQIIEGRDAATGYWLEQTVMHAVRTNITLSISDTGVQPIIDQEIAINYDVQPRNDSVVLMGIVTIAVQYNVQVPNRI